MTQEQLLQRASTDPAFWAEMTLPEAPGDDADISEPLKLKWWQREFLQQITEQRRVTLRIRRQCGKTIVLIVAALWKAMWTRREIMIICPQDSQVVNFYEKTMYFIDNTPVLSELVSATRQAPFRVIHFKTGATIKFMCAGLDGKGVRGQSCDDLILDECDELQDAAYKAILPVVNSPNKCVLAGTTINGRRSYFYNWVHDKNNTWVDIWVNPDEDPDFISIEKAKALGLKAEQSHEYYYRHELRLTDLAYMHEVQCIWADAATGVYRRKDIDRSLAVADYVYDLYADDIPFERFPTQGPTFMGVDWDKFQGVGPQIAVVQLDQTLGSPSYGKLRVIWREEIPPGDYCLGAAVQRIIQLNDHFVCNKIYVDPGMGERQIEELRLYGVNHPQSGLREKLVRFSFKAKDISFTDPNTGQVEKKENKHWMVSTSQLYFQEGRICLCPEDTLLSEHLRDYSAEVTKAGTITYTDRNEHTVDALNLAIVGYDQEMGETYEAILQGDVYVSSGTLPQSSYAEEGDYGQPVVTESSIFSDQSWMRASSSRPASRGLGGGLPRRQLTGFRRS
jgi:hypothetical protein